MLIISRPIFFVVRINQILANVHKKVGNLILKTLSAAGFWIYCVLKSWYGHKFPQCALVPDVHISGCLASYTRKEKCFPAAPAPLSRSGWNGMDWRLWSNTNILNFPNKEDNILFCFCIFTKLAPLLFQFISHNVRLLCVPSVQLFIEPPVDYLVEEIFFLLANHTASKNWRRKKEEEKRKEKIATTKNWWKKKNIKKLCSAQRYFFQKYLFCKKKRLMKNKNGQKIFRAKLN